MNINIIATVQNGKTKLTPYQKNKVRDVLSRNEGKNVQITIGDIGNKRSNNQNAYYWGCVLKLVAEHTGYSENELHEVFKNMFLPKKFVTINDREFEITKSTTQVKTTEFEEYVERIREYAGSELQVAIPLPNE